MKCFLVAGKTAVEVALNHKLPRPTYRLDQRIRGVQFHCALCECQSLGEQWPKRATLSELDSK